MTNSLAGIFVEISQSEGHSQQAEQEFLEKRKEVQKISQKLFEVLWELPLFGILTPKSLSSDGATTICRHTNYAVGAHSRQGNGVVEMEETAGGRDDVITSLAVTSALPETLRHQRLPR